MTINEKLKKNKSKEVKEIVKDLEKVASIDAIADMDGGKVLLKSLAQDIVSDTEKLASNFKTLTMQEFVGIGASLKTNIEMIRVLTKAKDNKHFLQELLEQTLLETE